ncbi:MAG TPA: MBG domain-containing protein, partial [Candidatus Saccharimonadales bacterium]|nr:MBG domain-containing protein [Candidatus Saccharimonadales bacterium]
MKNSFANSRSHFLSLRSLIGLCSAVILILSAVQIKAAVIYWDPQGTTGANPVLTSLTGIWESALWSTSSSGLATPVAWTESSAACFAVHTGIGTPAFTVTMNGNHTVAGFFIGPLTPNSCNVTISGTGIITFPTAAFNGIDLVNASDGSLALLTSSVVIAGTSSAQICAEGNGQLYLNAANTWGGGSYLGFSGASFNGIWNFNNSASFGTGGIYFSNLTGGALVVEGNSAITITNPVSQLQYGTASLNIVGNPAGVTFSGPWALSGAAGSQPVVGPVLIGSGGAAANLVTISGLISGTNGFTKFGIGTLALNATNTYSGNTIISSGTLALTSTGSISNSPSLVIGTNSTLDVSAVNSFTLSSSTRLAATGAGATAGTSSATINGASAGVVNLESQPILLSFVPTSFAGDTTHPALLVNQAALTLNNNLITVSNAAATALGAGTYSLIQVGDGTTGTINGAPNTNAVVDGAGLAAGMSASLAINGSTVNLVVAATANSTTTTLGTLSPITYGQSTTFTATVSPTPDGGEVQFLFNGAALGSPVPVVGGTATSPATSVLQAVGTYTVTAAYSGTSDDGASSATGSQVINKAALTVTANPQTVTYGTVITSPSTLFTTSGMQNGETIGWVTLVVSGGTAGTGVGTTNEPAGSLTLTPSAAAGGYNTEANYNITYVPATLTVSPKALTLTASAASKAYGSVTSTPVTGQTTFTSSGLVNGQANASITVTLTYSGITVNSPVSGSPYANVIIPSAAVEAAGKTNFNPGNYTITYAKATLTLTALPVKLTGFQNFNGSNWVTAGTLTVSNAVAGDTVNVALGLGFMASTNPGIETIASLGTLALGNAGDQGTGTGTGPTAQFNTPTGVALDGAGNAYVADTANNRVVEVTPGGVETVLPFTGLAGPAGVAVDLNTNVFVADPSLNEVVVLPGGGGLQTNLPIPDLNYPAGVAVDQSGNVFVADTLNSRVVEYATNGVQTTLPFSGIEGLYLPSSVAVDTNGDVFVANAGSNNIVELSALGVQSILAFSGLNFATSVAVDNNTNIYAANYGGANVKELSVAGVVTTLLFNNLTGPAGIAVDPAGDILVSDSAHDRIVETNSSTGFKALAGVLGVPNYTLTGGSGSVTNAATPSFVGLTNAVITYGVTNIALTGTVTAVGNTHPANGTIVTVTINGTPHNTTLNAAGAFTNNFNTAGLPVSGSPYTITYSNAVSGAFTNSTDASTTLTINPLPAILTGTMAYNGSTTTSGLTVSNAVTGDVVTVTGSGDLASANAGAEPINSFGTVALSGASAGNYTLIGASGAENVTADALAITANDDSKVYGQTKTYGAGLTNFSSTGLVNGETIGSVTIAASGGVNATDPVGNYSLTPSGATGGTFTPANYTITYNPGTLAVSQLTVVLAGIKPYDGSTAVPVSNLQIANAVSGDDIALASGAGVLTSPNAGSEAVGPGTLALGGAAAANYTLTGAGGSVTVTPVS